MAPALDESLATESGRLATFQGSQQITKRRASSTKKKASNVAEWPHETLRAEDFAHAGFYYHPTPHSLDNVECFLCRKNLDNWEPGDNPVTEHLSHVPDCGWAICARIEQSRDDETYQVQDPLGEYMAEARRATFREGVWPHQGKRGWKCQIAKMVEAGWAYAPTPDADDCVYCFHCQMTLDGWEPKDDPYEEHYRRNPDCEFFALAAEFASTRPKKTKRGSKRGSKAARQSTLSNASVGREESSMIIPNDDDAAAVDESILSTTSTRSRKKTAPKKANTKKKRQYNSTATEDSHVDMADPELGTITAEEVRLASPVAEPEPQSKQDLKGKRTTRNKKKATMDASILDTDEVQEPPAKNAKRITRQKKDPEEDVAPEEAGAEDQKPIAKSKRVTRQKVASTEDHPSVDQAEAADTSIVSTQSRGRTMPRGRKRGSDGAEKVDSSIVNVPEVVHEAVPAIPNKASKRGQSTRSSGLDKTQTLQSLEPENYLDEEPLDELSAGMDDAKTLAETKPRPEKSKRKSPQSGEEIKPAQRTSKSSNASKSKKGKKAAAVSTDAHELDEDADMDDLVADELDTRSSIHSVQVTAIAEEGPAPANTTQEVHPQPRQGDRKVKPQGREPSPKTVPHVYEDPAEEGMTSEMDRVQARAHDGQSIQMTKNKQAAQPTAKGQKNAARGQALTTVVSVPLSPALSAQSSDAENKPPSSRASSKQDGTASTSTRMPLQASTPTTSTSQLHRDPAGGDAVKIWQEVDMEALLSQADPDNRENFNVQMALDSLSSPEKKMTVEEWIYHNSERAEKALRNDCERMINGFEKEGVRALQALEKVECE